MSDSGSSEPPIWTSGTLIDLPEMLSFGVELRGLRTTRSRRTSIEVVIPPGVHHIVPFSIGGNGVVVGTAKTVATIDPVTDLAVDSFKGIGRVSWIWPPGVTLAEVSWTDQGERQIRTIGISEYHAHGVELPLGKARARWKSAPWPMSKTTTSVHHRRAWRCRQSPQHRSTTTSHPCRPSLSSDGGSDW